MPEALCQKGNDKVSIQKLNFSLSKVLDLTLYIFRRHLFKHHGREAYAKFVERTSIHRNECDPGICDTCGKSVNNLRLHVVAWHPDISSPVEWKNNLTKGIRKLSQKPRWAERLNKRQEVLRKQGKLPPNANKETIMDKNIGNDNSMLPLPQLDVNVTPQTSMASERTKFTYS